MSQSVKAAGEYEAKIALIQMGIRKLNDVVFTAPSAIEDAPHIVTVIDGKAQSCTCRWFKEGGWKLHLCAHAQATERWIIEEQAQATTQVAVLAEVMEVIKQAEVQSEYIRLASGGTVRRSDQERTRARGEFSLFR